MEIHFSSMLEDDLKLYFEPTIHAFQDQYFESQF